MSPRGLTLLELLIALALLVALGAIAFPAVMRQLDGRAFDAAADTAVNHLLLARAHAQTSRRPVEVIYIPQPAHLEARLFEPALAEKDDVALAEPVDPESEETSPAFAFEYESEDEEALVIAAGWAWRALPGGVELSRRPPDDEEMEEDVFDELAADFEQELEAWEDRDEEPVSFRIAVFLPDGSALLGEDAWLRGADGRIGRLTVNPFTGLPVFERLEEVAPAVEEEPDEEEEDEEPEEEAYEAEDEIEPPAAESPPAEAGESDEEAPE